MKDNRTFIIAEVGVNHNGDVKIAKKMIDIAIECGVDAVKFQTFKSNKLVSRYAQKAKYQIENTKSSESQLDMVKKLELSFDDFVTLKEYCDEKKIIFMSTAFDFESIDFLKNLGMSVYKIPSGEINNLPYLREIAKTGCKILLSTGMSNMNEIEESVNVLVKNGAKDISILHCTTEYPAPYNEINLNVIKTFKTKFKFEIGYSDHSAGIEIPIAAVAIGASIIEKHFTLDKNMDGPDHKASIEPDELKKMVESIRNIELSLGSYDKEVTKSEERNIIIARKSIVANCDIRKGDKFTEYNITTKRPGNGLSPMLWDEIIGKIAKRDFKEDELIEI